ncbi:MAG: hypothetical protein ABSE08_11415 [Syntrophobacteraceae bacterium]
MVRARPTKAASRSELHSDISANVCESLYPGVVMSGVARRMRWRTGKEIAAA